MTPKRLYIAGHRGLAGRALMRLYEGRPEWEIITRTSAELDLRDPRATLEFFEAERPEYVILSAARVGGIKASYLHPVEFLLENLQIQNSVIEAAHKTDVTKLLLLGSTCIYPKAAEVPIREDSLLTGPIESTNEAYAIAKIAGIKLCAGYRQEYGRNFIVAMPANLYGPFDNFDPEHSHALPSMLRKFHQARVSGAESVTLWGSGTPRREFLYVDDLASACAFLLDHYDGEDIVNIGCGDDISIRDAAERIKEVSGFQGRIEWDTSQPDGNPRRLLDVSKMTEMGWRTQMPFDEGLRITYQWFLDNIESARK